MAGLVLVVFVVLGSRWWTFARAPEYGIAIGAAQPAEDFTLQGSNGRPVTLSEFRGKPVLLYFGYTTCPDVCPTTLADLRMAMQELGSAKDKVQVLFVTVDPERDTAERLATYLQFFDPSFIGLTGSLPDIEAIASRFGVIFKKNTTITSAADYLVDHTSAVLLLDARRHAAADVPIWDDRPAAGQRHEAVYALKIEALCEFEVECGKSCRQFTHHPEGE